MVTVPPELSSPPMRDEPARARMRRFAGAAGLVAALLASGGAAWLWTAYGSAVFLALSDAALALCF